jgi:hypothetical protein
MNLSIIIVSWKVKEKLQANLNVLFKSETSFKFTVYVVDNNSQDGTVEMIKEKFPEVKLIVNSDNLGFAAANNQALKLVDSPFVLLLNPDMQVRPDTLEKVLLWAKKNSQATVVGCKLIDEQTKIIKQARRFPKFFDQLMVALKVPHLFPGVISKYLMKDFDYELAAKVDSLRGAFFLINVANWQKISGQAQPLLDERYFVWFEEVDFCRQVYQLGGEVWYTPAAECLDYVGSSFSQLKRGQAQKYFSESTLKYFQKWGKKREYHILQAVWGVIRIFYK